MKQIDKDVQTYAFNEGQITLINNVLSTTYKDINELRMMLSAWRQSLEIQQMDIDEKYNSLEVSKDWLAKYILTLTKSKHGL